MVRSSPAISTTPLKTLAPGSRAKAVDYRGAVAEADMTPANISVLFDRVLVRMDDADGERRSRAGILIPATAQLSKRLSWATVVSVGPHVRAVSVGNRVLLSAEDRYEVELDGEEYVLLRERDLQAVARVEEESGRGLYL
jgi:chaperonin GroES